MFDGGDGACRTRRAMVGSAGRYMSMPMGVKTVSMPNSTISSNRRARVKVSAGADGWSSGQRVWGAKAAVAQGFVMDACAQPCPYFGRHARIAPQNRQKHRHFRAL